MRRQRFWKDEIGWKTGWIVVASFAVIFALFGVSAWFQTTWNRDHPQVRTVVRLDGSLVHCADSRYRSGFGSPNVIDCTLSNGETVRFSLAAVREVRETA